MIYLGCPYSHEDRHIEVERTTQASKVAAKLIKNGHIVFSPIAYSTGLIRDGVMREGFDWLTLDLQILRACDSMIVVMLDGWQSSEGLQAEIQCAKESGMKVEYLEVDSLHDTV